MALAIAIVTQHVAEADFIFRTTDMNLDALPDNIGFVIKDIKIYESVTADDYRLKNMSLDRTQLMNHFSSYNFDEYCLAVCFVFRDFGQFFNL